MLLNILIVIATFCAMEFMAWSTHKFVMHGFMWYFHEDHHVPHSKTFERNDVFFLIYALPSWLLMMFGAMAKFDFRFYQMEDMHFLIRCGEEFTFYQIHEWTYIYIINPLATGRIGRDFEKYISNKNQCIDDMLTFKFNPLKKFLIWTKLTNGMFLLHGYIKYKPIMIFNGLFINLKNLFKFPNTYSKIVLRIVIVKFNEFFGSDDKDNRF